MLKDIGAVFGLLSKYYLLERRNCLHPVCYAAVSLLWFSRPIFTVSICYSLVVV